MARSPPPSTPWLTIPFLALLQALASPPALAQNSPLLTQCYGDTNYTSTSQYKSNLDRLLADLTTVPSSAARGHFRNASVGGVASPAATHGLAQCRGDVLPAECAACLNSSASAALLRCPLRRGAAIRSDACLLRYSDQNFLGIVENGLKIIFWNSQNTSERADPAVFDRQLRELATEITSHAAAAGSRFAVGKKNYSDFGDIYGLAECTRDLSETSCGQCLGDLLGALRRGKVGGRVVAVSCFLRFEIYTFFSLSVIPSPPPPPLQPSPSPPPGGSGASPPPTAGTGTGDSSKSDGKKNNASKVLIIVIILVVAAMVFLFALVICLKRRMHIKKVLNAVGEQAASSAESLLFDFETLRTATGNFSDANRLGEGGFGPVYKGVLSDGQQIAVKRLKRNSVQGPSELRNEVVLVAKLQHRNLARLLGFCLEEQEKMVVYEYLPNTSLDKFLFDPIKRLQLNWERRYKLIEGIARGIVYLHEDSRLRVVHRDLKASNILLDEHMNPKISDFGLAKLFGAEESRGNTRRIAGTPGYMAPEYVMHGLFSTKSDVFSFGVLVLEIVTGRRNGGFRESEDAINLLSYVWRHWNEGAALQLLDRSVGGHCRTHEVMRCIHIGLLCVQEEPSDRPSMSTVALMLSSFTATLPAPSRPAFLIGGSGFGNSDVSRPGDSTFQQNESSDRRRAQPSRHSANEVSISEPEPR